MIEKIVNAIKHYADLWHKAGLTVFEFEEEIEDKQIFHSVKLLYHNFVIWHYIDLYKSPDSNEVLFVYDKGIEHNRYRNQCIEDIDLLVTQKGTGKINSETIGSIIDRIGIQYIKWLHLADAKDGRAEQIKQQLDILIQCATELCEDMVSGERQCIVFSRFKIDYSEKQT